MEIYVFFNINLQYYTYISILILITKWKKVYKRIDHFNYAVTEFSKIFFFAYTAKSYIYFQSL